MGDGQTLNSQVITIVAVNAVLSVLAIISVILRFLNQKHKGVEHYV